MVLGERTVDIRYCVLVRIGVEALATVMVRDDKKNIKRHFNMITYQFAAKAGKGMPSKKFTVFSAETSKWI